MIKLLQCVKISVKLPVIVTVDNMDTIFMAGDIAATSHIKHMDTRFQYVDEYVKYGIVKIMLVNYAKNKSFILIKNLGGKLHDKHTKKFDDKE